MRATDGISWQRTGSPALRVKNAHHAPLAA